MTYLTIFYGIFILIGGIIGYVKAGSLASLAMGVIFGALLIGSAFWRRWGRVLALISTLFLDVFFTFRYLSTGKFNPPGVLALVSFAVLVLLVLNFKRLKTK
jgi:uncharacterized membrane protein (UPF0136 family)